MAQTSKYKRVVLKLSGEALAGDKGFGINPVSYTHLTLPTNREV